MVVQKAWSALEGAEVPQLNWDQVEVEAGLKARTGLGVEVEDLQALAKVPPVGVRQDREVVVVAVEVLQG